MSRIKIAVCGAGTIGRQHVELIQKCDSCELSAVVDPAPNATDVARRHGVPVFKSLDDLFASTRPDGVIVATPNSLHVESGLHCVRHGVPMLIEKPIADSLAEAERLVEAAERAGIPLLVGHHRRHSPILSCARRIVQDGTLGSIVGIAGSAMFYKPDSYFGEASWRREIGGGPILINMIHDVDNLRFLCGEISAVQAFTSNTTRGFPVEDTVAVNFRFASGALAAFMLSDTAAAARSWEQTSRENMAYAHDPNEDCYLIAGTRGSLAIPRMWLRTYADDRSWNKGFDTRIVHVEHADPLAQQLEHFCSVVREKIPPLVSGRDALRTLQVTLAIGEAARTGKVVNTE